MSLSSSSLNGYFPLPHIAVFSLALMSSSQCLSLWPTKVKSHHVFPSCSPPTMRWSSEPPTGGIKHMIYRAPSKTKKGEKKEKERSVFQLGSLGLQCSSHTSSLTRNVKNVKIGPHNEMCWVANSSNLTKMTENVLIVRIIIKININMCTLLHCTWRYFQTWETFYACTLHCTFRKKKRNANGIFLAQWSQRKVRAD